ncbi:imidazole glycerol phosphate synthase, glutamine amidotransferase subunit [Snodgrassella alvi]|jgi:imidazole glycerol-phosphate synthase subunit HisH|uniref:Imidazole glycerol phosphate synthase subunit HisH n=1 Tax=Snodgrassella alvi TaxID=1196083 RepID=A0A2N9XFL2_9NEIS|nr:MULTISPECIES: imidazole glycerol phosphate synthase subunit HisH [Snodgrassella]PIT09818.1 imidazole glycerol phosphate synthase, glutamine amidotransferase subunit [Snodgrassella communis]PIT20974.1 imidazole glycerol phosphate synthase, glutamine amidotransferase subunit [Snodgrassella communis]PIT22230.1 imidazole glycerol phosphate synthase, glutamine amidotransferase subunit [Snodgrassella communis]PIT47116.1 imidazole glycerol phosphate synthase, glutamine amidotransferase subunit [Sno
MKVAIVNYGMGNLHSVLHSVQAANQLQQMQAEIILTARPDEVYAADKIIFPGQGAMPDCMAALQQSGLAEALMDGLRSKPFFGICVGAQLLFDFSEEGNTVGLGWFQGTVQRFQNASDADGRLLKIPHMGWNRVHQIQNHPLFASIEQDEWFYFVHSYYLLPQDSSIVMGKADYGSDFACIVGKDNVFATQFHTEKSHVAGLQLLGNFLRWDGTC